MERNHVASAKVTMREQIRIPKKVSEKLGGVKEADYILFYEEGSRIYIKKGKITAIE
jgi:bifunctional DNA-binding transcriptional regulator/antitoxin component of YhaV-PrlF toxin-antitoxin module